MDNTKIEKIATSAVQTLFSNNTERINHNIASGDTGISFDGSMIIFSGNEFTKKGYLSNISVQVKGTVVDVFSEQSAKFYDFDYDTFKNFQMEDGVVVFLVEEISGKPVRTKIFYKFLGTEELQGILNYLNSTGNNTKVIDLAKIDESVDLDEVFHDIAVQRKSEPYALAKAVGRVNDSSLRNQGNAIFEQEVSAEFSKKLTELEYTRETSQFNVDLHKDLKFVLANMIVVDTKKLAMINRKISGVKELNNLPGKNFFLAILAKAKYETIQFEFDKAQKTILQIKKIETQWMKQYQQIKLEVNLDMALADEYLKLVSDSTSLTDEEKTKYKARYYLQHNDISAFEKILVDSKENDYEWEFLKGQYSSQVGHYSSAAEHFRNVYKFKPLIEVKYMEIQFLAVDCVNKKMANNKYVLPDNLLPDVKQLQQTLSGFEGIEIPGLEKLSFELEILNDPRKMLTIIEKEFELSNSNYEKTWLIEWKIRAYMFLGNLTKAGELIDSLDDSQINSAIIGLRIIILKNTMKYKEAYDYVLYILDNYLEKILPPLDNLLTEIFLYVSTKIESLEVIGFEKDLSNLLSKVEPSFLNLLQLERTRKKLKSPKYGESFSTLENELINFYTDEKRVQICSFIHHTNELTFGKTVYNILNQINEFLADEYYSLLLFNNQKYEEALTIIMDYENSILSETMIQIKAEVYLRTKQYRALLVMEREMENKTNSFLNRVLIAKINLSDSEGVQPIIDELLKSVEFDLHLNAADALVTFGIDIAKGVQIYIKKILELNFENNEINHNYLSLCFLNTQKLENKTELNNYNNIELGWYKLRHENEEIQIVVIPEEWGVKSTEEFRVEFIYSDFELEARGEVEGSKLLFNNQKYELIDKQPLSTYVFQRVLSDESGDLESDKPIKIISLANDLEELKSFMKQTDRTPKIKQMQTYYKRYHGPFLYERVVNKDGIVELFDSLNKNNQENYFVGTEMNYLEEKKYQISVSSLAYLWNLDLMSILTDYQNIYVESSQQKWLENLFSRALEDTSPGSLSWHEGQMVLTENTDERKASLKGMYKSLVLHSRKIKQNQVGVIDRQISYLVSYESPTIQVAIDNNHIVLIEDEALQICLDREFNVSAGSIGGLISNYFLVVTEDVVGYLDVLLQVIQNKSAWLMTEKNQKEMIDLVAKTENHHVIKKFLEWQKAYETYFADYLVEKE